MTQQTGLPRRSVLLAGGAIAGASMLPRASQAATSGKPVRIGATLALTGPLAQTGLVHKICADIYVESLNKRNGLLGRPVDYILYDDQSKPDVTRSLYEKLITVDKVDLIMGPYATAGILAAMGVAQRYHKLFIQTSLGMPFLATYDMQFPSSPFGPTPQNDYPQLIFSALASTGKPPKSVAIVTSKFPSAQYMSHGAQKVATERGLQVPLFLEYEFGTVDYGTIAARVKDADADMLWIGCLGVEGIQLMEALTRLNYKPRWQFQLYPAPGPMAASPACQGGLSSSFFEEHKPFTDQPGIADFIAEYHVRAMKAGVYPKVEYQGATEWAAWQMLEAAVDATQSLDDRTLANWLKTHKVQTLIGSNRFDGKFNHGDMMMRLKQVQDKEWLIIWPHEYAKPGSHILEPA